MEIVLADQHFRKHLELFSASVPEAAPSAALSEAELPRGKEQRPEHSIGEAEDVLQPDSLASWFAKSLSMLEASKHRHSPGPADGTGPVKLLLLQLLWTELPSLASAFRRSQRAIVGPSPPAAGAGVVTPPTIDCYDQMRYAAATVVSAQNQDFVALEHLLEFFLSGAISDRILLRTPEGAVTALRKVVDSEVCSPHICTLISSPAAMCS